MLFETLISRLQLVQEASRSLVLLCLLVMVSSTVSAVVTPVGTKINNTATASFQLTADGPAYSKSSSIALITQEINPGPVAPSKAKIDIFHFDKAAKPGQGISVTARECANSQGQFITHNRFQNLAGQQQPLPGNYQLSPSRFGFKTGEPLFIQVTEADKNLNPTRPDQIDVIVASTSGSDQEKIRLTETGKSTGIFIGMVQTARATEQSVPYDCTLSLATGEQLSIRYTDSQDNADSTNISARVDPYSRIFNATTGEPINGVKITLLDAATGKPAQVYADDGVTKVSSTVISGPAGQLSSQAVSTLAAGKKPDGAFRFPFVNPGQYQLEFEAPVTMRIPSKYSDEEIKGQGSGKYELSEISRGKPFTVTHNIFSTDIPVDQRTGGSLVTKRASKQSVAAGDFVEYSIKLTNNEVPIINGQIADQMPPGLRYVTGSAHMDTQRIADPVINDNSSLLLFALPAVIDEDKHHTLTYVAQVTALAKGRLANKAWLKDDSVASNTATAVIEVRDEFMKDTARLFGRVYLDDCDGNLEAEGIENIRLYMEDGSYVVTDQSGEWHIENVTPGSHVVQLDTTTIPPYMELLACDKRGFHAGRNYSQFVDVQAGSFWRVDFVLKVKDPEHGQVSHQLSHQLVPLQTLPDGSKPFDSPVEHKMLFTIHMKGSGVDITDLMEMVALPKNVIYEKGSSTLDGKPWEDPKTGYALIYSLGNQPANWSHTLQFAGIISDKAVSGNLDTRAVARFKVGSKSRQLKPAMTSARLSIPPASDQVKPTAPPEFANFSDTLTEQDKQNLKPIVTKLAGLNDLKVEVIGHTDNVPVSARNRHIFADNQALSEARARSVAMYLAGQLGIDQSRVMYSGRGDSEPVASNRTRAGRARNRRVEVNVLNAKGHIDLASMDSDVQMTSIQSDVTGFLSELPATAAGNPAKLPLNEAMMPEFDDQWFSAAPDQAHWVFPPLDKSPSIGSTKIAISHKKGHRIKLLLDDKPVSVLNFDGTQKSSSRDLAVSKWRGVDIEPGPNRFHVYVIDQNGDIVSEIKKTVQLAQEPAKAELVDEHTNAIADGITPAVIAVRLTDKDGFPIRSGVKGNLKVQSPYQLYDDRLAIEEAPLGKASDLGYQVGQDGIALIRLTPTNQSGEAVLTFKHTNGQNDELRVWMKPKKRDWILVALGDLAVGYNASSGDDAGLNSANIDDKIYHDGRFAFFAQGQVTGEWLMTAAYDSGKPEAEAFARTIDPDRYYTLYGDASQQRLDASSARKLYVKIERDRFYTVFGDINTDLTVTELGRYNRAMTGVQSAYQGKHIEFSAFAAENDNGFVRDEIQGDGTSGLYRFSNKHLILSSEKIHLEVRDRFRSEIIVSRKELKRDIDYVIDYQDGTIYFKFPVRSTDDQFNPRFIIAEYEVDRTENEALGHVAGGRVGIKLMDDQLKAGVTAITQNQTNDSRQLQAIDTTWKIDNTTVRAEVAQSKKQLSGDEPANAGLLEIAHRNETLEAKAYVRQQEEGFGIGQTASSENDFRKSGIEGTWYLSDRDRLKLETFHHYQLSNKRDKYQAQLDWIHRLNDDQQFSLGALGSQHELEENTRYSDQLTAGFSNRLLNDRLTLSAQLLAKASRRSSAKDQLRIGADYRLTTDYSIFAEREIGFEKDSPQRAVMGIRATPWAGASVQQTIEQVEQDDAYRLFAVSGLTQEFPINKHWLASAGYDQARNLEASAPGETRQNTENFYATYAGAAYHTKAWQWNNRVEYRAGQITNKWVGRTSLYHPLTKALATGGSIDYFHDEASQKYNQKLDAKFDLAIRPRENPYALLLQTRWVQQYEGNESTPKRTRKLINNMHVNWQINDSNQLAAQYGIKRVLDQYNSNNYASTTDFMAGEWRYHLTSRWDLGAHARRLHGYESGQFKHGTGLSIGFIPATNVWLSLGYNFTGFIDSDFSAANFTAKGVYLKMRFKADQDTLRSIRAAFY